MCKMAQKRITEIYHPTNKQKNMKSKIKCMFCKGHHDSVNYTYKNFDCELQTYW